jgi:hypothetical protein
MCANILSIVVILAMAFPVSTSAYAAQRIASQTVVDRNQGNPAKSNPMIWRDDFDGTLQPGWKWVNENPGEWSLTERPGFLTIWTSPFGTGGQNLLLRPAPVGDFTIETYEIFQPFENFDFAGLVLWQDEGNFLQFGRAYCDIEGVCAGNAIYFDIVLNGGFPKSNFPTQVENPDEAYLRLISQGSIVKAYYSGNGFDWVKIDEHSLPQGFRINAVGLTSAQHVPDSGAIPADFDYFTLNQVSSPFFGSWQAFDIDGGDIRLTIGGSRGGPYRVTWTESYFGFCGGGAGIARGNGWINADDPYIFEADLHLTCFTTGDSVDFHPVWRYDPSTGWLSSRDDGYGGFVTTWHQPGEQLPLLWNLMIAHPDENWVEGMGSPEGTVVSLLIRDSEGNRRFIGTAEAFRPEWDPNITTVRFFDVGDLKAGDHLWMSDGMVVRELVITNLQITEIDLAEKTVSGIATSGGEVIIEYFPEEAEPGMFSVFADQDGFWTAVVEDMTFGLPMLASEPDVDGDLSRVTIHTNAQIIASEAGNWFWTNGFNPGMLDLFIYESADEGAGLLWSDQRGADEGGFVLVDDHGLDLVPGNYIVVSDGVAEKGLVLQPVSVTMFDTEYEFMAGFAPPGSEVWAAAGPQEWQERINVKADAVTGAWWAEFAPFDILEEYQPWSYAHIYDEDGDANEGGVPPVEVWAAYFTDDPELWTEGIHNYHFRYVYAFPGPGLDMESAVRTFTVSSVDAPSYDGYVLLRPSSVLVRTGAGCSEILPPTPVTLNANQATRFGGGWITDYPMTYEEAVAHFDSMKVYAQWDDNQPIELHRQNIIQYRADEWLAYLCTFTSP